MLFNKKYELASLVARPRGLSMACSQTILTKSHFQTETNLCLPASRSSTAHVS